MVLAGKQPPERLGSDLTIIKLFEIADRLADQLPTGLTRSEVKTVGTEWVELLVGTWVSADIWNDGFSDVYIKLGWVQYEGLPWDNNEAPLKKNEHVKIDLRVKRPNCPPILAICQTGTASLRIFKLA